MVLEARAVTLFEILGLLVGGYTVYGVFSGRVFAKSGPGGRIVSRDQSPEYFWVVIVIYAVLSLALLFLF
jgi:hypothetical protein